MSAFRKGLVLTCFLFLVGPLVAQPGKPSTVKYLMQQKVESAAGLPIKMINISSDSAFWLGTDSLRIDENVSTGSACIMQSDDVLPYTKARFDFDALKVSIFKMDRQYVHELEITVKDRKFSTRLLIHARNGLSLVTVVPTDQVLVLEKSNFNPGDIISGYVNFRGTLPIKAHEDASWNAQKDWVDSKYTVRGPFRVRIE